MSRVEFPDDAPDGARSCLDYPGAVPGSSTYLSRKREQQEQQEAVAAEASHGAGRRPVLNKGPGMAWPWPRWGIRQSEGSDTVTRQSSPTAVELLAVLARD